MITLFFVEFNQVLAIKGDTISISPGKILPEGYNHYLGTTDAQVQLEYPRAYILQDTKGDLLFNVTLTSQKRMISIYIPFEFKLEMSTSYVWTSITNDYRYISLTRVSDRDPIAPNWYRINVSNGSLINPGSHYIRVFNVTAPSIAGLYFFKVFIDGVSIGAKNFPTLIVSADINPAYITGKILDGSKNATLYGKPIQLYGSNGGKVVAEGITQEGRIVIAQAFFNTSASYTIHGLAPGIYNLTASAAGYSPTTKIGVKVCAGQSLFVDLYVNPAPKIECIVWSKCEFGLTKWSSIAIREGPKSGGALAYVGASVFPGKNLIYALRGGGTSDLLRYDKFTNKWEVQRSTPGAVEAGGALAFDGLSHLYAFQGRSNALWKYDLINNSWSVLAETPANVGPGGGLLFNTNDGYLYALRGDKTRDFWRYDPITNTWTILSSTPAPAGYGGSLTFNLNDGKIYALRGDNSLDFWRYDPSSDSWEILANTPGAIGPGGALTYDSNDGKIYALRGGGSQEFWEYDPVVDSWIIKTSIGEPVNEGGALAYDAKNGHIFAFLGGGSQEFWEYDPVVDSWIKVQNIITEFPKPITIEILDSLNVSKQLIQDFTDPISEKFVFYYDGFIELDGHIPQDSAGYVSGIKPGKFQVKAWVSGYIQTNEVWIQLQEYGIRSRVQFDLYKTGSLSVVVYFKGLQGALSPVTSISTLLIRLYDQNDILKGENSTTVTLGATSAQVVITGFLNTLRDYGLPQGTYIIRATMPGYYQPSDVFITLGSGCNNFVNMSLYMLKTGTLKVTVRSVNWQVPPKPLDWAYPGSSIKIEVRDAYSLDVIATYITRQIILSSTITVNITGLKSDMYSIFVFTPGYYQRSFYRVYISDGTVTDIAIDVIKGGVIELELKFMKEYIFSSIDTYPFALLVPLRVEIYDEFELQFMGANISYVPYIEKTFALKLIGFKTYAGNPALRWLNYYDTTDGVLQRDYGLSEGKYSLKVYLPGYKQSSNVVIELPAGGEVNVIIKLERLGHLFGNVYGLNMYNEVLPLSWVSVNARSLEVQSWSSTLDGYFDMWLQKGSYLVSFTLPGYEPIVQEVFVGDGSETSLNVFYMKSFGYGISEFPLKFRLQSLILLISLVMILILKKHKGINPIYSNIKLK
ncbi:MAG: hypothetical protein QW589_05730 [Candidatus Bathyarchaeia archaeon]